MYIATINQMEREARAPVMGTEGFGIFPLIPVAIAAGGALIGAGAAWGLGRPAVDAQGRPTTATGILSDRIGRGVSTALLILAGGVVAYKFFK